MSTFLRVLSVNAFLLLVFHIPETEAAEPQLDLCNNTDTSTNTSKSRTNLELLFSSLSSNASQKNWFYRTYIGQDPNNANGRAPALCRICSDCIATAGDEIRSQCSNRSARMWYSICNLRTSRTLVWVYTWNILNVSDPNQFKTFLGNVMSNLTTTAANQVQVATQYPPEADMEIVLGPVLCLRDISAGDCDRCVGNAIAQVPNCCNGEQNRIVIKSFCSTGSKVSSFYDPSAIGDLSPSTPPILAPVPPPENTARPSPAPTDAIPPSTEAARPHNETRTRDNSSRIIPILVPTIAVAIVLFIIIALLLAKKTRKKTCTAAIDGIVNESDESFQIDFDTVRVATNDFSDENKLGEGGFGPVYKGSLSHGQEIAVKRLSRNSGQGVQEFMNEVALVAKLQHKNLVRILGCCVRGEEKLLVYEYVPNRSLDYFLFDPAKREVLNWNAVIKLLKELLVGYSISTKSPAKNYSS